MGRTLLVVVLCSACSFHGALAIDGGGGSDAADAIVADVTDAPPICETWSARHFMPCAIGSPMMAVPLPASGSPYTYDTTTDGGVLTDHTGATLFTSELVLTQTDSSLVAVMNVDGFALDQGSVLNVIGSKPLLIASWSTLVVAGDLDAGSHMLETDATTRTDTNVQVGAGADVACGTMAGSAGVDAPADGGSGGGGGGGFGGNGGAGGKGDNLPTTVLGGPGGVKLGAPPALIRGGCPGAASGQAGAGFRSPASATTVSNGGAGGGAVELAARLSVTINGTVRAGGAAGAGAPQGTACGGGGGGGGGYLGLDSPIVIASGILATNGGGGGGSAPFANFGNVGVDGQPSLVSANGGGMFAGGTCGEPGSSGGAAAAVDGGTSAAIDACGGGGGGGGAGEILVFSPAFTNTAVVSPAAAVNP